MSEFKFGKGQYALIPSRGDGVKAVILERKDSTIGENQYLLAWPDQYGNECRIWFGEAQMLEANPQDPIFVRKPYRKSSRKKRR